MKAPFPFGVDTDFRSGFVSVVLAAALPLAAGDWPQFRGPDRNNAWTETGVTRTLPAGGWPVRWRKPVQYGWASPVVAEGKVYVFDAELLDPKSRERIHCFDAASGEIPLDLCLRSELRGLGLPGSPTFGSERDPVD